MITRVKFNAFHNTLMRQIDLKHYYWENNNMQEMEQCQLNILSIIDKLRNELGLKPIDEIEAEQMTIGELEDLFK